LDTQNFLYLPKKFHNKHRYCEFVITQIEQLLLDEQFSELRKQTIHFTKPINSIEKGIDLVELLEKRGMHLERQIISRNIMLNSLIIDTCYFIQEGLVCSLKMRLSVTLTLFRKPFLETLLVIMRIITENDFMHKFINHEGLDPINITSTGKKKLISDTNYLLNMGYPEEALFKFIYDKDYESSLLNISNRAIHLYTNRNEKNMTGKENLNFIFSGKDDIENIWKYIYSTLPLLLTFLADTVDFATEQCTSVQQEIFLDRVIERRKMQKKYRAY